MLVDELDRGKEEVEQEPPLSGIEFIELINKMLLLKPLVTEILSDMSPVFSLDVERVRDAAMTEAPAAASA